MTWVAVILAGVILSDILFGQLVVIPEKANALIFKTFQTKNKQGKAKNRKGIEQEKSNTITSPLQNSLIYKKTITRSLKMFTEQGKS